VRGCVQLISPGSWRKLHSRQTPVLLYSY
jgi:hypothetical protein